MTPEQEIGLLKLDIALLKKDVAGKTIWGEPREYWLALERFHMDVAEAYGTFLNTFRKGKA